MRPFATPAVLGHSDARLNMSPAEMLHASLPRSLTGEQVSTSQSCTADACFPLPTRAERTEAKFEPEKARKPAVTWNDVEQLGSPSTPPSTFATPVNAGTFASLGVLAPSSHASHASSDRPLRKVVSRSPSNDAIVESTASQLFGSHGALCEQQHTTRRLSSKPARVRGRRDV